jgi:ribosomal-protein-alanine N-acetyltransferase
VLTIIFFTRLCGVYVLNFCEYFYVVLYSFLSNFYFLFFNIMSELKISIMSKNDITAILCLNNLLTSRPWYLEDYLSMLSNGTQKCIVAKINAQVVGFLSCNIVLDEIEILQIAVAQNLHRNFIGTTLMRYIFTVADNLKVLKIYLEVSSKNYQAISFYNKLGFKDAYIRKNYYASGEDAIIKEIVFN